MSSSSVVDIGEKSLEFQQWASREDWETVKLRYHGFADLTTTRGDEVLSPEFTCLGRTWRLHLYPGGEPESRCGMVSVFLYNRSHESIKIRFGLCVKDSNGREVKSTSSGSFTFGEENKDGRGYRNFAKRSTITDSLVAGALIIEVRMMLAEPPITAATAFVPENPFCNLIQQMFMDEESADVAFEVGLQQGKNNSRKSAMTAPATFYAHRLILEKCGSQLVEFCGDGGKDNPMFIDDVEPHVFRHMLSYVYGGKVADDDLRANSKEIMDAADKYGIGNLKLEAEACFVKSTTIDAENVMEHLLYADAKNCALLKEAVMDFIVKNKVDILQKISFEDVPGSMVGDILAAVARGENKSRHDQPSSLRISDLRRKVHQKGLDVDGSRETLIAALQANS